MEIDSDDTKHILAQFINEQGELLATPFDLPVDVSVEQLQLLCNALVKQEKKEKQEGEKEAAEDPAEQLPYSFFINDNAVSAGRGVEAIVGEDSGISTEGVIHILYEAQAVFKVRAVTRCTSSIQGHAEAVISVAFSPSATHLASGSGDTTVRFWDVTTETPLHVARAHRNWVLCVNWAPDGRKLASADKSGHVCIWDPSTGKQIGKTLAGHKQWVTYLAWEPLHKNGECRRLASASKDMTVRIWDIVLGHTVFTLSGHTHSVTCVKWGGVGLIYTASQDRNVKVWRAEDGALCRTLTGHAHWVNILALNTDYVMRTGAFDPAQAQVNPRATQGTAQQLRELAEKRYASVAQPELMISGSDDFTMFLWRPAEDKKPVARMTGHQQLVNDVKFSPDGRLIASASFDKSVKLWQSATGRFVASLRGHVQAVYQLSWSADSRLICTGSADSTLKVWHVASASLLHDLPGHGDDIYAVDWAPDGQRVASGGKDKVMKIWRQ